MNLWPILSAYYVPQLYTHWINWYWFSFFREHYLFTCNCEKCEAQAGDPEETSEDEDDDDDEEFDDDEEGEMEEIQV